MTGKIIIPGIWLNHPGGIEKLFPDKILYCHHSSAYTTIVYMCGRTIDVKISLTRLERVLDKSFFLRCHRNYIVNIKLTHYCRKRRIVLLPESGKEIPVSRLHYPEIEQMKKKL